jgi:hypothetical protein
MTDKRSFWIWIDVGVILLYILIVGGSYLIGQPGPGWILFGLLELLHLTELPTAVNIGREKGVGLGRALLMNMIFGFTWWVPLKKGVYLK